MTQPIWKQMFIRVLLVVGYPLIWLYYKAKDAQEMDEKHWRWYR